MINLFISGIKPKIQKVARPDLVELIIVDLFCGAGGTTTGFNLATVDGHKTALVVACVNHDPKALESHWRNHPDVVHFEEDIRTLELSPLVDLLDQYRKLYPNAKVILWASLECTNFSKAKGGQPRDADSRTLADHLPRYITALNPDYIQIENVVEFMSWGPLDKNGKPVSRKNGSEWLRWRENINAMGYRDEWRELNSADFGAYTSRNRLFGCFAKGDLPIVWPTPTHAKNPKKEGLFGDGLKKWMPVKDVLDFDDEGESIFNRKKPLVDASLERIYSGLVKFVAGGKDAFILKYNSTDAKGRHTPPSVDEPCPTVACQNRLGIVNTKFILNTNFNNVGSSIDQPAPTLVSSRRHPYVVNPNFLVNYNHSSVTNDIDKPAPTLVCKDKLALVNPSFLCKYHGNEKGAVSVEHPASTLSTKDRLAVVQPRWLDKTYSGVDNKQSIEQPAGTIMTNDHHRLITCDPFILNPSHGGHCTGTDVPCVTIVARQDKAPLYLVQYDIDPNVVIPIYEDDSEVMRRIKAFMAMYGISDIKMRMLKVPELLLIQGFPKDYILVGNQSDQKKFIGNSVVPHVVKYWALAMRDGLIKYRFAA